MMNHTVEFLIGAIGRKWLDCDVQTVSESDSAKPDFHRESREKIS